MIHRMRHADSHSSHACCSAVERIGSAQQTKRNIDPRPTVCVTYRFFMMGREMPMSAGYNERVAAAFEHLGYRAAACSIAQLKFSMEMRLTGSYPDHMDVAIAIEGRKGPSSGYFHIQYSDPVGDSDPSRGDRVVIPANRGRAADCGSKDRSKCAELLKGAHPRLRATKYARAQFAFGIRRTRAGCGGLSTGSAAQTRARSASSCAWRAETHGA